MAGTACLLLVRRSRRYGYGIRAQTARGADNQVSVLQQGYPGIPCRPCSAPRTRTITDPSECASLTAGCRAMQRLPRVALLCGLVLLSWTSHGRSDATEFSLPQTAPSHTRSIMCCVTNCVCTYASRVSTLTCIHLQRSTTTAQRMSSVHNPSACTHG